MRLPTLKKTVSLRKRYGSSIEFDENEIVPMLTDPRTLCDYPVVENPDSAYAEARRVLYSAGRDDGLIVAYSQDGKMRMGVTDDLWLMKFARSMITAQELKVRRGAIPSPNQAFYTCSVGKMGNECEVLFHEYPSAEPVMRLIGPPSVLDMFRSQLKPLVVSSIELTAKGDRAAGAVGKLGMLFSGYSLEGHARAAYRVVAGRDHPDSGGPNADTSFGSSMADWRGDSPMRRAFGEVLLNVGKNTSKLQVHERGTKVAKPVVSES